MDSLKPYALFSWSPFYPKGGTQDLKSFHDSVGEAVRTFVRNWREGCAEECFEVVRTCNLAPAVEGYLIVSPGNSVKIAYNRRSYDGLKTDEMVREVPSGWLS